MRSPPGIRPLTADGSRRAAPLYFTPGFLLFFSLSSPPPTPPRRSSLSHGAKRARKILREKNATASVPIPASTAQCTRQKHPLNIGVYGPRRGKSARVKPPWSFGHLSAFAVPFLYLSFSQSLSSRYIARSLSLFFDRRQARVYPPSSKPTSRFSRFFAADCLSYSILILFAPIFRLPRPRTRAYVQLSLEATHGDKRHRRQKCCPPPAENGAVILMQVPVGPLLPSPLPATPVEVRGIRASSNTAAIPRFLLNPLTYFTFRAPSSLPFRSALVRRPLRPSRPSFFHPRRSSNGTAVIQ